MNATREVASKSDGSIERETAAKWAERAFAAYKRYRATGDCRWFVRAHGYESEALEHAALAPGGWRMVKALEEQFKKDKRRRWSSPRRDGTRRRGRGIAAKGK